MVGGVHNQGSAPVEWFKSLIHKASDSLSHFAIKIFGSSEDKTNLKTLDQVHASLVEIHLSSRRLENSIYQKSKQSNLSDHEKNMLRDELETLVLLLKIQKTDLQRIRISAPGKNTFIEHKKSEESHLIDSKMKHLEYIRNQIPS